MTSSQSAIEWQSRDLHVAPLSRRFDALLINVVCGVGAIAAALGTIVAFASLWKQRSPDGEPPAPTKQSGVLLRLATGDDPETGAQTGRAMPPASPSLANARGIAAKLQSRPVGLGLHVFSFLLAAYGRERRGPGYRVLSLRVADARSGGAPTRSQQIVRAMTRQIWRSIHQRPVPRTARAPESAADDAQLRAEIESAHRRHEGDREALQLELARIFRENRTDPVKVACLPLLARLPLSYAIELPIPWSPLRQSFVDRLSNTVVVLDRAQSVGRRSGHR